MTSPQHQVPELPDGLLYAAKRRLLGPPLVTEQLTSERLSKPLALGVLSSDGLSPQIAGPFRRKDKSPWPAVRSALPPRVVRS